MENMIQSLRENNQLFNWHEWLKKIPELSKEYG